MGAFSSTFGEYSSAVVPSSIPTQSDALVWLDGTIDDDSGTKYFVDKSGNNRNFLITGYDFDESWTGGFPYKTNATISAPSGDTELIAADINSFLYTSGTPNQIPVVSFFQDIDFEHKIFARHEQRILDSDELEIYEPRVKDIVVYNSVRTGTALSQCQTYFDVPAELDSTQAVWIAPTGNDTTGTGTKASPWKTLTKVATQAKAAYIRSGVYTLTAPVFFSGATATTLIGTGFTTIDVQTYYLRFYRVGTSVSGIIDDTRNVSATGLSQRFDGGITYNRCKLGKSGAGTRWAQGDAGLTSVVFNDCIIRAQGLSQSFVAPAGNAAAITFNGCYGTSSVGWPNTATNAVIKYNKFQIFGGGKATNTTVFNNFVTGNFTFNTASTLRVERNRVIDGTLELKGSSNPIIKYNYVHASYSVNDGQRQALNYGDNVLYNTGGEIYYNTFIGSANSFTIAGIASQNDCKTYYNKFVNEYVGGTTGHTIFVTGINHDVRWNEVIMSNGHGIVIKSGGLANTDPYARVAYNVFKCTGYSLNVIWNRGAVGVIFSNNTCINYTGTRIYALDDGGAGLANSMTCYNNFISLGGDGATYSNHLDATDIVFRNNVLNLNGFTSATPGDFAEDDFVVDIAVDANGAPSTKVEHAEIDGANNVGLASNYSIPGAPTFQTQDSLVWQNGAVVLQ